MVKPLADPGLLLVLVDQADTELGLADKMEVHRFGSLHRAVSVFVFDSAGRLLLQQRSRSKYHSSGLWSNSCCTHPLPGEPALDAAHRCLRKEMGFDCDVQHGGAFVYRADVGSGLIEHEYDHLYVGYYEGALRPNPSEVSAWRWANVHAVIEDVAGDPSMFTAWFPLALNELCRRGVLDSPLCSFPSYSRYGSAAGR